jgi:hypothetical protein
MSEDLFKICNRCNGTGRVPGRLQDDRKSYSAYGCDNPACNEGLVFSVDGLHLMEFLDELAKRNYRPFNRLKKMDQ